jgi:toxin ParE1/3/4
MRFTPSARAQFLAAVAYVRRDNPLAAAQFRRDAERALRRLQRFPNSDRIIPKFPELSYRAADHRFPERFRDYTHALGNMPGRAVRSWSKAA